jgi:predicted DNA-binding WGR domain protein
MQRRLGATLLLRHGIRRRSPRIQRIESAPTPQRQGEHLMETTCVTLFKEAPESNMRRQYSIDVVRDLFGANVVVCRWGRIGAHGQRREHVCASNDEAQAFVAKLVRKHEARGYARHRASRRVTSARRNRCFVDHAMGSGALLIRTA